MGIKEDLQANYNLTIEEIEAGINALGFTTEESNFSKEDEELIKEYFQTEIISPESVVVGSENLADETAEEIAYSVYENTQQMQEVAINQISQLIARRTNIKLGEIFSSHEAKLAYLEKLKKGKKNRVAYLPNYLAQGQQKQLPPQNYPKITPGSED